MKKKTINELLKGIINETIDSMLDESHDKGEWWIDSTGGVMGADRDVGDSGHDGLVIHGLTAEILEHFGVGVDEPDVLGNYEEYIREALIAKGRFSEEDQKGWNNERGSKGGPSEIILEKLIEDKAYKTPEQAADAVAFAYGGSYGRDRDPRDYAMKYWQWKRMESKGGSNIHIQTWHLKPEDLGIIVRGIWEIMGHDYDETPDDSDKEIGKDNYPGPRIDVEVRANNKEFFDIPLAVLEKKMPTSLINYRRDHIWMKEGLTEDYHHLHKEYRLFEGKNKIVAVFEDNTRLCFEVHFHNQHGPDKEKWRRKAFSRWKSVANEIHGDVQLSDAYNPIQKSWKQAFKEALEHPKMQEFIRKSHHQKVFDPVNFTQTG